MLSFTPSTFHLAFGHPLQGRTPFPRVFLERGVVDRLAHQNFEMEVRYGYGFAHSNGSSRLMFPRFVTLSAISW